MLPLQQDVGAPFIPGPRIWSFSASGRLGLHSQRGRTCEHVARAGGKRGGRRVAAA